MWFRDRRLAIWLPLACLHCASTTDPSPGPQDPETDTEPAVDTPSETGPPIDSGGVPAYEAPAIGGNVLFLLSDDHGVDKVGAYREHPEPPRTPTIDALAADGVLFRRAYAAPVCTPTRAALLTGRYNDRYGIGEVIHPHWHSEALPTSEVLLPEALLQTGYANSAVGKWHLAGFTSVLGTEHPVASGFSWHAGSYGNLPDELVGTNVGIDPSYYWWQKSTLGVLHHHQGYATTNTVDDALARLDVLPEPWFLYVAFNAPHAPVDLPPDHLHGYDIDITSTKPEKVAAMIETMDTEIARLLSSIAPDVRARTTIVFMGDNGTDGAAMSLPWRWTHAKNTPYEGGIRVPLIISGPAVVDPGREVEALVHAVDLFPTVTDLAGVDLSQVLGASGEPVVLDGSSLLPYLQDPDTPPIREYVYTGKFGPNGPPDPITGVYLTDWDIVLDTRWKYIRGYGEDQLYDLANPGTEDGLEGDNLLVEPLGEEAQDAYDRLVAELAAIEARAPFEGLAAP